MHYYKVIGTKDGQQYKLGFTSNKWAWIRNANGWKKEELTFIRIETKVGIAGRNYNVQA